MLHSIWRSLAMTKGMLDVKSVEPLKSEKSSQMEVGDAEPFVFDVAHEQCAIEGNATFGEFGFIRKVTGVDVFDFQRFDLPGFGFQADAIEAVLVSSRGVTERAGFEKVRSFSQIREF